MLGGMKFWVWDDVGEASNFMNKIRSGKCNKIRSGSFRDNLFGLYRTITLKIGWAI